MRARNNMDQKTDFTKLAAAKSILSEKRLKEVIAAWEQEGGDSGPRKLWDVAFELGYITGKAHEVIAEHMGFIEIREEDKRLGELAAKNGVVNASELEVALILQRKNHKAKKEVKRLEQILAEMGALLPFQLQAFRNGQPAPEPPGAAKPAEPAPAPPPQRKIEAPPEVAPPPAASGVGEQLTLMRHDGSGRMPAAAQKPEELPELVPAGDDGMPVQEAKATDIVHFQQGPDGMVPEEHLEELEPEDSPLSAEEKGTTVVKPAQTPESCDQTLDLGAAPGFDDKPTAKRQAPFETAATVPPTPVRSDEMCEQTLDLGTPGIGGRESAGDDTLYSPGGLSGDRPELDLDSDHAEPGPAGATLFVPGAEHPDDLTDFSDVIPDMDEVGHHPFVENPTDLSAMTDEEKQHFLNEEGTYMGMTPDEMEEKAKKEAPKEEPKKKKKGWFGRG